MFVCSKVFYQVLKCSTYCLIFNYMKYIIASIGVKNNSRSYVLIENINVFLIVYLSCFYTWLITLLFLN